VDCTIIATRRDTSRKSAQNPDREEKNRTHQAIKKALRENGEEASKAIKGELEQLFKTKSALTPVTRKDLTPKQLRNVIRSSMFLKTKFDATGAFEKIKARLVADGRMQDKSMYPNSSSPSASMQAIMTCLTIAAKEGAAVTKTTPAART
jgi:hypothetical protein